MGIAKLYNQKQSGIDINGIIEDYYVYEGEKVSAGDFVEFINGFSGNLTTAPSNSVAVDTVKNSGDVIFAVPLDNNRVFIAYRHYATGDASVCGVVCTIENEKILVGTVTKLHDSVTTVYISALNIAKDKVFVSYGAGSKDYLYGVVCNINGTVITHGANTQISTVSSSGRNNISTMLLGSGKIFIVYERILGIVCTINNTTITFGTETTISSQNTSRISAVGLGNNRAFVAHSASSSVMGAVCTITNTTIVVNVDTSLISGTNSGNRINTLQLDNDRVVILHSYDSSYFLYGMVCKVVDNTITTGTDTAISSINSSAYVEPSACLLEDGIFVGFGGGSAIHGVVCSINELELIAGAVKTLSSDVASIVYTTSVTLPYNNVFMAHVYGSDYYLYAQIFGTSDKTPSNNVTIPEYETQVRKATTSDIYGVAKTSGMGAYKVVEYTIPEGESVNKGEGREYNVETLVEGDIVPKTWSEIEEALEYSAEDGTILTAKNCGNYSCPVCNACDGGTGTFYQTGGNDNEYNWLKLNFSVAKKISKMKLVGLNSTSSLDTVDCKIEVAGSNDDNDWTYLYSLDTTTNTSDWVDFDLQLSNVDYYKYYILYLKFVDGRSQLREWQVSEYATMALQNGTALQSGTAGDTIQIAVPISDEESTGHKDIIRVYQPYPEKRLVMADGNILTTSNGDVFLLKEAI